MQITKIKIILFSSFYFVLFLSFTTGCQRQTELRMIEINSHKLRVEISDSQAKRAKGLSNRDSMPENNGMLFIFDGYQQPYFWMKDMRFPLDIMWLKDQTIVEITPEVAIPTSTHLIMYQPGIPVNSILEVNAGWVKRNGILIGDKINIE